MLITKRFRFEAAHNLLNYKGDCEKLHGHSYRLEVTLEGEVGADGFVVDFREIEKNVNERVIKILDHSYLNDVVKFTSCENLVKWIWDKLKDMKPYEIRLFETTDSWVTYRGK